MALKLGAFFEQVASFFSGVVPAEKRVHKDFLYHDGEHWFYNERMQQVSHLTFRPDHLKVGVLLDDADLNKLDDCPYIAKLGLNVNPKNPFKHCAFLYPQPGCEDINDVSKWVTARAFPKMQIFTYGETDPRTRQWIPGRPVPK